MQIPPIRLFRIAEDLLTLKMAVVCSSEMLEACLLDGVTFHPIILQFVVLISASSNRSDFPTSSYAKGRVGVSRSLQSTAVWCCLSFRRSKSTVGYLATWWQTEPCLPTNAVFHSCNCKRIYTLEQTMKAQRSSDLSLTSAPDGGGWSAPRRGRFTPGKDPYPLYRRLGGPQGLSGLVRTTSHPSGLPLTAIKPRSVCCPALSLV